MNNQEMINISKKKGFTLIELLAVIIILAIIALITVPIIYNIIENSKKGAAKDSAYGYNDAISKFFIEKLISQHDYTLPDGVYAVNQANGYLVGDNETLEIQFSGRKPTGGSFEFRKNTITQACVKFGDYAVSITNGEVKNVEKASCNGTLIGTSGSEDTQVTTTAAQTIMAKAITESALNEYSDKSTVKVPVTINHPAITENTATGSEIPALTSYRYMGADPDNYIYFNCDTYNESDQNSQTCEMWRIISVENGQLKITTADSIGSMPWDEGYVNHGGNYVNDWATSDLNDFLNGKYLNNGVAINYTKNGTEISIPARTYLFDYTISATGSGSGSGSGANLGKRYSYLNSSTTNMISDTTWYLGGGNDDNITSAQAYALERGNNKYTGDSYTRTTSVIGKVAIMSLSDYGYASSSCYNGTGLNDYYEPTCTSSNWLLNGHHQWLLTPSSDINDHAWYLHSDRLNDSLLYNTIGVRPVVYLNSNITLTGNGTSSEPYKIIK